MRLVELADTSNFKHKNYNDQSNDFVAAESMLFSF